VSEDDRWDAPVGCRACGDGHAPGTLLCPVTGDPVTEGPCGTTVDRYAVLRRLGGGGMGAVYRARHTVLAQDVALKLLHPRLAAEPDVIERFVREARTAAALRDPRIVQVFDSGTTPDGTAFLAMELLQGESLEALVDREAPMPTARAVAFMAEVLDVLALAHDRGVVHRDLKPANVFVLRDAAGRESVKLLDFGISKTVGVVEGVSLTQTGTLLGTPVYMAPEQATSARGIDRRADLYAAGVMLYEMLSGRLPHTGHSATEILVRLMTEAPTPLAEVAPTVPPALCAVVAHAMARDPAERFDDARTMAASLREALVHPAAPTALGLAATAPQASLRATVMGPAVAVAPWAGPPSQGIPSAEAAAPWEPLPAPVAPPVQATRRVWVVVVIAAVVSLALGLAVQAVWEALTDDDDAPAPARGPVDAGVARPAMAPMGPPRTQPPEPVLPDLF
jgi:tRNA A-37 threonylcarbamoyl transferase component Bud32